MYIALLIHVRTTHLRLDESAIAISKPRRPASSTPTISHVATCVISSSIILKHICHAACVALFFLHLGCPSIINPQGGSGGDFITSQ